MTQKIRWGIVGTGQMARAFATGLSFLADADLVAVASRTSQRAERFARDVGAARWHGCYEDLAAEEGLDVIYVATPPARHAADVTLCLEAGKAVLCERPLALNPSQAQALIDLAAEKKLFLMEAMWTRFVPALGLLRAWLEDRVIGNVSLLVGGTGPVRRNGEDQSLFDLEQGGGVLLNCGVDLVAMTSLIAGRPITINAIGAMNDQDIDEQDVILLGYPGGGMATLYLSRQIQQPPDFVLYGDKGSITVHAPVTYPPALTVAANGRRETITCEVEGNGYQYQAAAVMDCLVRGEREHPLMPLSETLRIHEILNEIRLQTGLRFEIE